MTAGRVTTFCSIGGHPFTLQWRPAIYSSRYSQLLLCTKQVHSRKHVGNVGILIICQCVFVPQSERWLTKSSRTPHLLYSGRLRDSVVILRIVVIGRNFVSLLLTASLPVRLMVSTATISSGTSVSITLVFRNYADIIEIFWNS